MRIFCGNNSGFNFRDANQWHLVSNTPCGFRRVERSPYRMNNLFFKSLGANGCLRYSG